MYKKKLICLNCDKRGHAFKNCVLPIRSYGIIAYKEIEGEKKFLLIQRKDTIGKTDFIRGKYKVNGVIDYNKLRCLIEEMTDEEKYEILNTDKELLWKKLWLDHSIGIFRNEKYKAMKMFEEIDYKAMLLESIPSRYTENEWGFPKGRKNLSENGIECATREFLEETGLSKDDFVLRFKSPQLIENFTASDGVSYTHVYYLAQIKSHVDLEIQVKNTIFKQEVKDLGFFSYNKAYKMFRDYDTQKRHIHNFITIY
jgi:8-oxo-dGTP pyrophosphatase MutT (NUDIX family)